MTTPNIIAERSTADKTLKRNPWKVWLVTSPQVAFRGETIFAALENLLDHYGREDFIFDDLTLADDRFGRVEITLPMRRMKLQRASHN